MLDSVGRPAWKSGDGAGRQRGLCGPLGREVGGLSLTKAMSASRLVDYFALVSCAFHPVCVCVRIARYLSEASRSRGGGCPALARWMPLPASARVRLRADVPPNRVSSYRSLRLRGEQRRHGRACAPCGSFPHLLLCVQLCVAVPPDQEGLDAADAFTAGIILDRYPATDRAGCPLNDGIPLVTNVGLRADPWVVCGGEFVLARFAMVFVGILGCGCGPAFAPMSKMALESHSLCGVCVARGFAICCHWPLYPV